MYSGNPVMRQAKSAGFWPQGKGVWVNRHDDASIKQHGRYWYLRVGAEKATRHKALWAAVEAYEARTVIDELRGCLS